MIDFVHDAWRPIYFLSLVLMEGVMFPILAHHLEFHHVPVLMGLFAAGSWIGWHVTSRWIGWR